MFDPFWRVDPEHLNGRSAASGLSAQQRSLPVKMLRPGLRSRMEKRRELAAGGIVTRNVESLGGIAVSARQAETVECGASAMFSSADVIEFVRQDGVRLGQAAILTLIRRPSSNLFPQRWPQAALASASETRALACSKSSNWPTRRYFSSSACLAADRTPRLFASSDRRIRACAASLKRSARIDLAASWLRPGWSGTTTSSRMSASVMADRLPMRSS